MKRKLISTVLALLLVASMAFAGMNEKGKGMPSEGKMKGENCQLLTDDERAQVADAKRDFEKKAILLRAQAKVLAIEVNEMIVDGKSVKDISATQEKLNNVKAQLAQEQLTHKVEVRKLVGEDKYKKMQMHMKMMQQNKGDRGKKMGGKHDGRGKNQDCRYEGKGRSDK